MQSILTMNRRVALTCSKLGMRNMRLLSITGTNQTECSAKFSKRPKSSVHRNCAGILSTMLKKRKRKACSSIDVCGSLTSKIRRQDLAVPVFLFKRSLIFFCLSYVSCCTTPGISREADCELLFLAVG